MTTIRAFRVIAGAEAITGLLLALSMIAKYALDRDEFTPAIGLVHGIVFLVYVAVAIDRRAVLRWDAYRFVVALAAAFVPLGTYLVVERPENWAELERRERSIAARRSD